jgi:hypothetical protein
MITSNCDWCGADLGPDGDHDTRYPEACGRPECEREVRNLYREMEAEREERAREDNYERY